MLERLGQNDRKSKGKNKGLRIVIVGCGKVGQTLLERLEQENHDITVVDKNPDIIAEVTTQYDIFGVVGIDLTGFGIEAVEGWGFPNILYTRLAGWIYPVVILAETGVSVLAAILATMRVRKLEVAGSLREEA